MANPNIVNVSSILGVSTFIAGISTTSGTVIVNNSSANTVVKVNSIIATNITANTTTVTLKMYNGASGAGGGVGIASAISLPSGASLAIIGKDMPVYVTENNSIVMFSGALNTVDAVASYEIIS